MLNIGKNFIKTFVVLGCTILQLIALVLRVISLVFETIGWVFRSASSGLMNMTTFLLGEIGVSNEKKTEQAADT